MDRLSSDVCHPSPATAYPRKPRRQGQVLYPAHLDAILARLQEVLGKTCTRHLHAFLPEFLTAMEKHNALPLTDT